MTKPDTSAVIESLRAALGADMVLTDADIPARNMSDATMKPAVRPAALVLPRTTSDVSTALRICHDAHHPVVTQGGMTGLAAGAHPDSAEIALSLEKLRGIEEVDAVSGTITALAGTPLTDIQEAAGEAGFLCGIDLGARGTCTIGGNVATNAGGNQVLRYGMTRANILGLEAVQADGTILTSLNKMLKNNTGYDWTQLFVGSEGTLGVVTRVVVSLHPEPGESVTALVALPSMDAASTFLREIQKEFGAGLLTFEGMWSEFMRAAVDRVGLRAPFEDDHELCVLLEIAPGGSEGPARVSDVLGAFLENELISDAIVAQSLADTQRLWAYRESVYEYRAFQTGFAGYDVSVPRPAMGQAVADLRAAASAHWPNALSVIFGHIADCNLHLIVGPTDGTRDMSDAEKKRIDDIVYPIVGRHHGSVSAEHGIGRSKRGYLPLSRSVEELALMKAIKATLDPHGILNPGRVL